MSVRNSSRYTTVHLFWSLRITFITCTGGRRIGRVRRANKVNKRKPWVVFHFNDTSRRCN